jgi:adenylylsulfate kinase
LEARNIVWHQSRISREQRQEAHGHRGVVLWFTGLSASGKSTLAHAVEEALHQRGCHTFVLDGDNVRHGLCSDLGFSLEDRDENLRRVGEVAKLFLEAGVIVLTAFISPLKQERERVRALVPHGDFVEIYCAAPLEVCAKRDPKGLYERATKGLIANFTGISSPYEAPVNPDLFLETDRLSIEECVARVMALIGDRGVLFREGRSNVGDNRGQGA